MRRWFLTSCFLWMASLIRHSTSQTETCSTTYELKSSLDQAFRSLRCSEGLILIAPCPLAVVAGGSNNCLDVTATNAHVCSDSRGCTIGYKNAQHVSCSVYQEYSFGCNDHGPCKNLGEAVTALDTLFGGSCRKAKLMITACKACPTMRPRLITTTCTSAVDCLKDFSVSQTPGPCRQYQQMVYLCTDRCSVIPRNQPVDEIQRKLRLCPNQNGVVSLQSCVGAAGSTCAGYKVLVQHKHCSSAEQCVSTFNRPGEGENTVPCSHYYGLEVKCFRSGIDSCPMLSDIHSKLEALCESCPTVNINLEPCPGSPCARVSKTCSSVEDCLNEYRCSDYWTFTAHCKECGKTTDAVRRLNNELSTCDSVHVKISSCPRSFRGNECPQSTPLSLDMICRSPSTAEECLKTFTSASGTMCSRYYEFTTECVQCGRTSDAIANLNNELAKCENVRLKISACSRSAVGNDCSETSPPPLDIICRPPTTAEECLKVFSGPTGSICSMYEEFTTECVRSSCNRTSSLEALIQSQLGPKCVKLDVTLKACGESTSNCKDKFPPDSPLVISGCSSVQQCLAEFTDDQGARCTSFEEMTAVCPAQEQQSKLSNQNILFISIGGACVAILIIIIIVTGLKYRQKKRILSKVVKCTRNPSNTTTVSGGLPYSFGDPCATMEKYGNTVDSNYSHFSNGSQTHMTHAFH